MLKEFIYLFPCFVCLNSAITLFISYKKNNRSQNIWMLCMLLMAISVYIWNIYYNGISDLVSFYKLDIVDTICGLSYFPLVRLYFKTIMDETPLGWKEYLWFLPGVLIASVDLLIFFYIGEGQAAVYIQKTVWTSQEAKIEGQGLFSAPIFLMYYMVNIITYYIVLVLQLVLLMKYTLTRLVSYKKQLDEFYSNTEGKSVENIKAMLIGVTALVFIMLLAFLGETIFFRYYPLMICLLGTVFGSTLYFLNYQFFKVEYTAADLAADLRRSDQEAEEQGYAIMFDADELLLPPDVKRRRREDVISQLNALLDNDRIFLQADLRLNEVANLTQTSRSYISALIREEYHCNFSELINSRRIAYAKQLTLVNPGISHAYVAEESGFSHPSSFSRVFKQQEGLTFKEWYKKNIL